MTAQTVLSCLKIRSSRDELRPPDTVLTSEAAWAVAELKPSIVYNIVFRLALGDEEATNAVVTLFDIEDDDAEPRNLWGSLSPQFGSARYRYLPPVSSEGLVLFKVTGPASGRIRLGLRSFRNKGPVLCSPVVAVEELDEPLLIAMSDPEIAALRKRITAADLYLEFGTGGSTALAASLGRTAYAVESDASWIEKLRQHDTIRRAEQDGRLHFYHADIGPTGMFGIPLDITSAALWPRYFLGVWESLPAPPDFTLVDGRFRLACAVAALIATPDGIVAIHDVGKAGARRSSYDRILDVADEVERVDSLLIVKRGASWSPMKALALLAEAAALPS